MTDSIDKKEQEIADDLKELVIARLEVLSSGKKVSVGGDSGVLSREDLIKHVREGDQIGKKIMDVELTFLRALKDGKILEEALSSID